MANESSVVVAAVVAGKSVLRLCKSFYFRRLYKNLSAQLSNEPIYIGTQSYLSYFRDTVN